MSLQSSKITVVGSIRTHSCMLLPLTFLDRGLERWRDGLSGFKTRNPDTAGSPFAVGTLLICYGSVPMRSRPDLYAVGCLSTVRVTPLSAEEHTTRTG